MIILFINKRYTNKYTNKLLRKSKKNRIKLN